MGATGYLEKPIDKTRLVGIVDSLVGSIASPVVLVVDDDKAIVELLSRTLKQRGHAVMAAFDGREAMAALSRQRPDAILLDLKMPVMDGYEVLEALKHDPATADIPVVIMSAYRFDQARADTLKLAAARVCKPFDVEDFVTQVEAVITEEEGAR
jgi:CheY-like chemotaxis protein